MRRSLELGTWWAVLVLFWLATVTEMSWQEVVAAGAIAVPGALVARVAGQASRNDWRLRLRWARGLLVLPWAVAKDAARVFAAVLKRDNSVLETVRLCGDDTKAQRAAHEAVATVMLSATPGTVVLDASSEHDALLVHRMPPGRQGWERTVVR
ncbi:Na+/H+ antiporter subunit E [Amycolatopsis taiwanensis]|uniref:Uncharacterized protein n=1 Tax=Amycolatopsis taiwanensis TaxID=342230 RepID=A0A9W6R9M9_9PSEU|nr:Na+/H+ antiporter subunit E [Amycolatopsis taiwanensis]GLY70097.1 hypothetical protein Atai01_67160 [Amycolatopsis taiwanensis]